jgi:SAM-dependent methyltransferase
MRDYLHFDAYLNSLGRDIYEQPSDEGHSNWARKAIGQFGHMFEGCQNVLDVGCGTGFCEPFWTALGIGWTGVTLGHDANAAKLLGKHVLERDMTFLGVQAGSYDIVFARHVLEHSPFPLLTMMEWRRVARKYLLLIAPAPEHWGHRGRNHYSMLEKDHLLWLAARAGWRLCGAETMTNHSPEYLDSMTKIMRHEALRIRPALEVEWRLLFEIGDPETE